MQLSAYLDRVDAELSSPAALVQLRSYLQARGATPEIEAWVVRIIKAALAAARLAAARPRAYTDALGAFWTESENISQSIDSAYCTLALLAKWTPVLTRSDRNTKDQCLAALGLLTPYLSRSATELDAAIGIPPPEWPGKSRRGKGTVRPMAEWKQIAGLIAQATPPSAREGHRGGGRSLPAPEHFRGQTEAAPPAGTTAGLPADVPLYEVWYGTNRKQADPVDPAKGFANERDPAGRVYYGACTVEVPRTHQFGSLGTPFWKRWLRLKFTDDHLKLRKIERFESVGEFLGQLRDELQALTESERSVLVYLHGYNTSFEDAALRAAQIGFDLKAPVTAFYSWPSMAEPHRYTADIARVEASEAQIADFLTDIAATAGAARVHVIAHSMGNRGFARAVARITSQAAAGSGVRFGQIILAAPDLDVDLFRQLAAAYPKISERTTMYVSARDKALGMSSFLQDSIRAGFTPPVTVLDGIDTVEVTNIDLTVLGHGYFAEAQPVLYDIKELIDNNRPPQRRLRVDAHAEGGANYWVIRA